MAETGENKKSTSSVKTGKNKDRLLDDAQIVTKVQPKAREAVGWYDSKLSRERERVLQYYNSQLPLRQSVAGSSYISTDVYDAVETQKGNILEVFAGGDDIAKFDPDQDMNAAQCEAAMAWAKYVVFQQNDGYKIFNDVIHDGLSARIGPAKVWWEEREDEEERSFDGLKLDEVYALAAQEEVDDLEAEADDETGLFSGTFIVRIDRSQVRILQLPPEEFLVEPRAVTLERANYLCHRSLKTKAELKEMGFDEKKVDEIHYDDGKGLDLSPEVLARNSPVETLQALDNPIQPEMEKVMLYESYAKMVIWKSKGARWYKIFHVDTTMFEFEEVDKPPFIVFTPLPVPHIVFGNNFAARVIPTQNARTVIIRAILDHTSMTVSPRWQVVNGGLMNPREMLDNRMGGLVNVRRPDTLAPLAVPNMNPFVFQLLELMQSQNEQTTGISQLSQGLNKDAISKQNSRGLVGDMVNLGTQRGKIIARNFAYTFFVPLLFEVIRLSILHQKKKKVVEVAGQPLQIDAQSWTERTIATVSMHLGYGEKEEMMVKLKTLYEELAQDQSMSTCFTAQNRFNLITDICKAGGIYGAAGRYITPPQQAQPPKPNPLQMAEVQAKTTAAQAALITAQAKQTSEQRNAAFEAGKLQQSNAKLHLEAMEKDRTAERQDLETMSRVSIAERQMQLEEKMRPEEAKQTAIINPRA